ncbi:MAG TPA: disulfide oxidoreductase [Candidatus Paceibacterota bacterium]
MTLASTVNILLSVLVVVGQLGLVLAIVSYCTDKKFIRFLGTRAFLFSFIVSLIAMLGSLTYSNILGYAPCVLCWYQRILMYPLVFMFGLALKRKEVLIAPYALLLSVIGAIIALYHYLMQLGIVPEGSCGAVGYSVSCAQRFVMNFGYITIPMMALTAFLLIITFILSERYVSRNQNIS